MSLLKFSTKSWWILGIVLVSMSFTLLTQQQSYADDNGWLDENAAKFCGIKYASDTAKKDSCVKGYAYGSGTGETCKSVPEETRDACMEGYNRKVSQQSMPNQPLASSISACDSWHSEEDINSELSKKEQEACKDGYKNGIGDGSVCKKYDENPLVTEACVAGWEAFKSDVENCTALRMDEQVCRNHLRKQAIDATSSSSSSPPPQDPSQKKGVGVFPSNGDISKLITYKTKCTESDPSKCAPKPCDSGVNPEVCQRAGRQCKPDASTGGNCDTSESEKCALEGFFGDMMCGITRIMGSITDTSYSLLSTLLTTDPVIQTSKGGGDSSMYTAWAAARGIANIFFIITLLVVILSYVTNMGVSTYNIKRIVPRIITTAILVNSSFWVCALFVDISNILGAVIVDTLGSITSVVQVKGNNLTSWQLIIEGILLAGAATVAASSALIYGGFGVLLPFLVTTLISVVTVFLMMLARQVLIILFIIVSPIAFASVLLPGTSSLFEKWRKMFVPTLMLYPIVGLLFGLSKVASDLIVGVAANTDQTLLAILGLGIQIAPLVLLPRAMAFGGNALNSIGNIKNSSFAKNQQQKATDYADHKKNQHKLNALSGEDPKAWQLRKRVIRRKSDREARREALDEEYQTAQGSAMRGALGIDKDDSEAVLPTDESIENANENESTAGANENGNPEDNEGQNTPENNGQEDSEQYNDRLARKLAQSDDLNAVASARNHFIKAKVSAKAKLAEAKRLELRNSGIGRDGMLNAAMNKAGEVSQLAQDAAVLQIANSGDIGAILQLMKNSEKLSFQQRRQLMRGVASSGVGNKIPFLGNPETQDSFIRGEINATNFSEAVVGKSLAEDDWSANTFAELDQDAMKEVTEYGKAVASGNIQSNVDMSIHGNAAHEALNSKETQQKTSRNSEALKILAEWRNQS